MLIKIIFKTLGNRSFSTGLCLLLIIIVSSYTLPPSGNKAGKLKITFINIANGKPIVLQDSMYPTPSGELYSISKLRYYISNIKLPGNTMPLEKDNYQLIDEAGNTSFTIPVKEGKYNSIRFLLGIDSMKNCSGIQDGVLDPMKDMFWTWNTGYVIFKLEGNSASSTSGNHRIEHHIGGYRFGNNVSTPIQLQFPEITINKNGITELFIEMNMDRYWSDVNDIRISEMPVCTLPGGLAKKIAANFPSLFSVKPR